MNHSKLTLFLTIALALPTTAVADAGSRAEAAKVRQGLSIAPVPLNLQGKDQTLVGLGSYLVNAVGGCNDCHTDPSYSPGGDPFSGQPEQINTAGYLAGGATFTGGVVSPDLRPDSNGLPHGLTFGKFRRLLRTGKETNSSTSVLQVMPWPVYKNMTNRDLRAIYEYLRAIPGS